MVQVLEVQVELAWLALVREGREMGELRYRVGLGYA